MKNLIIFIALLAAAFSLQAQENTSSSEPVEVVRQFLTAYRNGDHAKFASLLHPDVIWVQPGDSRISGTKKSKTELLQMGARMAELSGGTIKLTDVKYFSAHGNSVVCILHWKGVQSSGILDIENIDVYTVENGKIVLARVFSQDIEQENRFWGK